MAKSAFRKLLGSYLSAAIAVMAILPAYAAASKTPAGILVNVCGSGRLLFIPLKGENNPDPNQRHVTACHAICASKELESDEDA